MIGNDKPRKAKRIMRGKSLFHKWYSSGMEPIAHGESPEQRRKQGGPSGIESEKPIRKEGAGAQILNLQGSRNPGWHQYPRDPV